MHALEPNAPFQVTKVRRRYRRRPIVIAIIRSILREICSCFSGIFVLKLNFVHTTKTSLNPTNIVLVNQSQQQPRQQVQITELPPDTDELPCSSEPPQISQQLRFTADNVFQRMLTEKNLVLEYVQDGFKSVIQRIAPVLSRFGLLTMAFCVVWHKTLTQLIIYPLFRLLFGTLYPAYASYKAVKTKNVREYVKWMMYWIVFALFTCAETFTDVFLSWFPFYYEIKIILVIWLLSPATKGSSILYRKFVHPMLSSREQEIDEYISKAKEQSYKQVLDLGSKGVNALMQTAIKGGGGLVNQIRKSYSLSDLSEQRHEREYEGNEETDSLAEPRVVRRRHSPRRHSPRRHTTTSAIYFSEVDVRHDVLANMQTVDDISSGYSSGELAHVRQVAKIQGREALVRTGSIGSSKVKPTRVTRSTLPKKSTEDLEYKLEYPVDSKENVIYLNDKAQFLSSLDNVSQNANMIERTSSEEEFQDCIDHDGNVDFTPSNINISSTLDIVFKDMMHESLENTLQACNYTVPENNKNRAEFSSEERENNSLLKLKPIIYLPDDEKEPRNNEAEVGAKKNKSFIGQKTYKKEARGGKYNKLAAPLPPPNKSCSDFDLSAIKATLVLQPGVVKSLGVGSTDNEIFCHSPKLKRHSLNISSSNTSSTSRKLSLNKSKLDISLSRLKMLPKKISFLHKDDSDIEVKLKTPWYDMLGRQHEFAKEFSKSDDDISKLQAREKLLKRITSLMDGKRSSENRKH